jgi:uncharacterized protein
MANVVVFTWELMIPGCRSLKEKRTAVRSLRDRLQNRFQLSVAETGLQDVHDRAEITAALVASDGRLAESLSSRIEEFVADDRRVSVLFVRRENV